MTTTLDQSGQIVQRGRSFVAVAIVQSVAGAMFLPLLARTLDAAELGVVAAAQVVMLLTVIVISLGLPGAVTREFFDDDGPERSSRIMGLLMISAPLLVLLVHLAGPLWSRLFDGISYNSTLQIAVWTALPKAIILAGMARLRAELRSVPYGILGLATALGSQGVGILLLQQDPDVVRYVAGVGVVHVVLALAVLVAIRPRFDRLWELTPSTLRYSLPVAVHSSAGFVVALGDRVVIERILGLEDVGRYQIAYSVGSLAILALLALNNAWGPLVLGAPIADQREILADTTRSFVRLSAALMVGLAAACPLALAVIAPASYDPSALIRPTMIVTLTAVPLVLYLAGHHLVILERRTLRLAVSTIVGAVVNVVANVVLIGPLGLEGAALATVLSYLTWAAMLHSSRDARSIDWQATAILPALALAGSMMVVLFVVPGGLAGTVLRVVIALGAATAVVIETWRTLGRARNGVESHAEPTVAS